MLVDDLRGEMVTFTRDMSKSYQASVDYPTCDFRKLSRRCKCSPIGSIELVLSIYKFTMKNQPLIAHLKLVGAHPVEY